MKQEGLEGMQTFKYKIGELIKVELEHKNKLEQSKEKSGRKRQKSFFIRILTGLIFLSIDYFVNKIPRSLIPQ